jgi:hypothetical protein
MRPSRSAGRWCAEANDASSRATWRLPQRRTAPRRETQAFYQGESAPDGGRMLQSARGSRSPSMSARQASQCAGAWPRTTERRATCDFAGYMRELVDFHDPQAVQIHVVLDNYRPIPWGAVRDVPSRGSLRIVRCLEFHVVPEHASWLNMVENDQEARDCRGWSQQLRSSLIKPSRLSFAEGQSKGGPETSARSAAHDAGPKFIPRFWRP